MEGAKSQQTILALLKHGSVLTPATAVAYWLRCLAALGSICMRPELGHNGYHKYSFAR